MLETQQSSVELHKNTTKLTQIACRLIIIICDINVKHAYTTTYEMTNKIQTMGLQSITWSSLKFIVGAASFTFYKVSYSESQLDGTCNFLYKQLGSHNLVAESILGWHLAYQSNVAPTLLSFHSQH